MGALKTDIRYEVVIGLEVHAQLLTRSKMFCSCSTDYVDSPPNTHVCPVCLGMPGVLPVINRQAVEFTIMTGLALNCQVPEIAKFDRKNYPYPDLMKGYQISQYDLPLCRGGWLEIEVEGRPKRIGITRVHLEEDVAKLLHRRNEAGESYSLVDVNRSGVPLMEIVSEPELRSPEEARAYLMELRQILQYLEVCAGNMEEGNFRCDANISLRPLGSQELLGKVEVKNMNSFRAVHRALSYEVERQREVLAQGGRIVQETRGWVEELGRTVPQRTKEYAHDYRYFPEPDLPPLHISRQWVEEIRGRLPELPGQRRKRFQQEYGLSPYEAALLTEGRAKADFFEACLEGFAPEGRPRRAKAVSNWLLGEVARFLNETGQEFEGGRAGRLTPRHVAEVVTAVERGQVNTVMAKTLLWDAFRTGEEIGQMLAQRGLTQITDEGVLMEVVGRVMAQNPKAVADYRSGKAEALKFLMGQVMRETRGRAHPGLAQEVLRRRLGKASPGRPAYGPSGLADAESAEEA